MNSTVKDIFSGLLSDNTVEVTSAAVRLMIKCLGNILKNPDNPKYRRLRVGSREITDRLIPAKGAIECLILIGFEKDGDYFVYPQNASLQPLHEFLGLLNGWQASESASDEVKTEDQLDPVLPTVSSSPSVNQTLNAVLDATIMPSLAQEQEFYSRIHSSMQLVQLYEDTNIQKRAKTFIPLNELNHRAQLHHASITSGKMTTKIQTTSTMDLRDCLLLELLFWFKHQFFTWFDQPDCPACETPMSLRPGPTAPTPDEQLWQAGRVESYECNECHKTSRFPRYNHPLKLLTTRTGRCGEWANCFTLLCRTLEFEARYVLDWTDHVWTEVYSATQKRWLHCDPCENACDAPLLYENGWGKKLSYVIAFSRDDVQDVTWRYSARHQEVLQRRLQCRESWLLAVLLRARNVLQESLDASRKSELAERLVVELVEFMTPKTEVGSAESAGRLSGSLTWRRDRAELGAASGSSTTGGDQAATNFQPFTFELSTEEVVNRLVHVKYCAATDKYVRMSASNAAEISGWRAGVWRYDGVFRKVEHDWKMTYLARNEGVVDGALEWRFDCAHTSLRIAGVEVRCCSAVFENGSVERLLVSGSKSVAIQTAEEIFKTVEFDGLQEIKLSVKLTGGKGVNAWQHAQLFRQSTKDKNLFPLEIIIKFN